MKRYKAQKGDICCWPYRKVMYVQEYTGRIWSEPIALQDLASARPALYRRVARLDTEPERYELVHSIKRFQKHHYREKDQAHT